MIDQNKLLELKSQDSRLQKQQPVNYFTPPLPHPQYTYTYPYPPYHYQQHPGIVSSPQQYYDYNHYQHPHYYNRRENNYYQGAIPVYHHNPQHLPPQQYHHTQNPSPFYQQYYYDQYFEDFYNPFRSQGYKQNSSQNTKLIKSPSQLSNKQLKIEEVRSAQNIDDQAPIIKLEEQNYNQNEQPNADSPNGENSDQINLKTNFNMRMQKLEQRDEENEDLNQIIINKNHSISERKANQDYQQESKFKGKSIKLQDQKESTIRKLNKQPQELQSLELTSNYKQAERLEKKEYQELQNSRFDEIQDEEVENESIINVIEVDNSINNIDNNNTDNQLDSSGQSDKYKETQSDKKNGKQKKQKKDFKPYKNQRLKTLTEVDQIRNLILAQETKNVSKNICLRLSKFATAEKIKFNSISKLREYLLKNQDRGDVYNMIDYLQYEFLIDIAHQTRNKMKIIYAKYRLKFINGLKDLDNFKQLKF